MAKRRAVARGAKRAFLVGDMPFGSYETGVRDAVINATRMLKEGGMDAVKLEGGCWLGLGQPSQLVCFAGGGPKQWGADPVHAAC